MDARTCSVCGKTVDVYTLIDDEPVCSRCIKRWAKGKVSLSRDSATSKLYAKEIKEGK
jgi:endogenous inhibitor of DNA gyrase (YacG/DUF329 family)